MRILVIGASGGSGRAVCDELLDRGHRVTAFARRAGELPDRPGLARVPGDATNSEDLDRVLPGHDAMVVILGISEPMMRVRLRGASGTYDDVRSRGTHAIVAAARRAGIERIVVQSSYGVGETRHLLPFASKVLFAVMIKPQIADTEVQEHIVRASGLDWTLVQPVYLTDGERAEPYLSIDGSTRQSKVSRATLARVSADLATTRDHVGATVSVSG
jgi:uncharacterized protein YbjT (DUF2867 family)